MAAILSGIANIHVDRVIAACAIGEKRRHVVQKSMQRPFFSQSP